MKILTVDESAAWLDARSLRLLPAEQWGAHHQIEIPAEFERLAFAMPQRATVQVALAQLLAEWFVPHSALLLADVSALFETHEVGAFLFLRYYYGDSAWREPVPGGATPGHVFADGDPEDPRNLREFLNVVMAYTRHGCFVQDDGSVLVRMAGELIELAAREPARMARPREIVQQLKLKP